VRVLVAASAVVCPALMSATSANGPIQKNAFLLT